MTQAANICLVLFGFYDLLIGYLIFRSTFLPRILGVLMALAGLGWLTFLYPRLQTICPLHICRARLPRRKLSLMLWLLVKGVNAQRWKEQAGSIKPRLSPLSGAGLFACA